MSRNTRPFADVVEAVSRVDPLDAAAAAGGLQLLAENGHHLERLEALALVAASVDLGGPGSLSAPMARALLNDSSLSAELTYREDPFEDVLIEEIAFHGGTYAVGGGLAEHPVELFRLLVDAIVLTDSPNEALTDRIIRTTMAALRLSDAVFSHGGLRRGDVAEGNPQTRIQVPSGKAFAALKEIVSFSRAELEDLLRPFVELSDLDPLCRELGGDLPSVGDILNGRLSRSPILRASGQDRYVLALPHGMLAALRHWLIIELLAAGQREWLARRFATATASAVRRSLSALSITETRRGEEALSTSALGLEEFIADVDAGSAVHVLVLADDFDAYDEQILFGQWRPGVKSADMAARVAAARGELGAQGAEDVLTLVVLQPAGRGVVFPYTDELARSDVLIAPAADLEIIARAERGDPLALTKFAEARAEARAQASVVAPGGGVLDEFSIYRNNGHVHPMVGKSGRALIWPTEGRELRIETKRSDDFHPVRYPTGVIIDVERWLEYSRDVPIYGPAQFPEPRVVLLTETQAGPVWVRGPKRDLASIEDDALIAQMLAYWSWQLAPSAASLLEELVDRIGFVVLDFEVVSGPGDLFAEARASAPVLEVTIGPGAYEAFLRRDNYADRELISPYVTTSPVPVISYRRLARELGP